MLDTRCRASRAPCCRLWCSAVSVSRDILHSIWEWSEQLVAVLSAETTVLTSRFDTSTLPGAGCSDRHQCRRTANKAMRGAISELVWGICAGFLPLTLHLPIFSLNQCTYPIAFLQKNCFVSTTKSGENCRFCLKTSMTNAKCQNSLLAWMPMVILPMSF